MHYNIVLRPQKKLSNTLTDLAQSFLKDIHNGYCLEEGKVLPHITLAQFHCEDESIIEYLKEKTFEVEGFSENIAFKSAYITPKHNPEAESLWIGLEVYNTKTLQAYHERLFGFFEGIKILLRNPSRDHYWPHLTLGRIRINQTIPPFIINPELFDQKGFEDWQIQIGHSDEYGQYLGNL